MKKLLFYILLILITSSYVFCENLSKPRFLILNTTISSQLYNQPFYFILLPEKIEKGNYLQIFKGKFPVPSHFEIDLQSAFIFYSDELCSFCLHNYYTNLLEGDIYKGEEKIEENRYLSRVFFSITENLGKYDIGSVSSTKFILLTKVERKTLEKKVILMSKSKPNSFFQVITAFLSRTEKNLGVLDIGSEFFLSESPIINNDNFSTSVTIEGKIILYIEFNRAHSIICYKKEGECDEN